MAHSHLARAAGAAAGGGDKWQGLGGLVTVLIALHVVAVAAWIFFTASDARAAKKKQAQD